LRLGLSAGADTRLPGAGFYGHLIPSRIAYDAPHEFTMLTFYHSEHGVLLNLDGERFCDETEGDHLSTLAVLEQREARALLVTDQRAHDEWMLTPYVEGVEALDKFALAYRRGARCATAESLDEFAELPEEWGYAGGRVHRSLVDFNEQAATGTQSPPRRRDPAPLVDPPYYVIEVIPAITNTFEGLRTDVEGRVQDASGEPIDGLYAAGADAGGTYYRAYAGGLATALIQGLAAAESVVARLAQSTTQGEVQ
jgi:succinate dehydrogenase/fumarate reductase flavoprotein subunit